MRFGLIELFQVVDKTVRAEGTGGELVLVRVNVGATPVESECW